MHDLKKDALLTECLWINNVVFAGGAPSGAGACVCLSPAADTIHEQEVKTRVISLCDDVRHITSLFGECWETTDLPSPSGLAEEHRENNEIISNTWGMLY